MSIRNPCVLAGVAILVTLLQSSVLGATWVDVEGGVTPDQAANATVSVPAMPAGVVGTGHGVIQPPPSPEFLPLPFDYVYLDPHYDNVTPFPWTAEYTGFREQHLYLAGEIGRGGTIDQIALFRTYLSTDAATFPNVSVKMCRTNVTALTGTFNDNYGGQTPVWVFHQDSGFVRGGSFYSWDAVNLQTPFDYNGTDNLLVEITWIGSASGYCSHSWLCSASGNRWACADDISDTLVAEADYTDRYFYNTRIGFRSEPNDVGVLSIISPIEFVGFGDSVLTRGRVANSGSQAQVNVPVICVIYDSAAGARVYAETVYVASLDTGEVCMVTFPSWDPPMEDRVYFDTMMTVLPGDEDTTNDWKARRFTVASWAEGHLTYNDGEANDCWSWTTPNYSLGVRFPGPCSVSRIAVGLSGYTNEPGGPYPCTCKVRLNDGANGMPGTIVWEQPLLFYTDSAGHINYVVLDPPAEVTSDSFYVTWKPQQVANPFLSADEDAPIQIGNDFGTRPGDETWGPLNIGGEETDSNVDLIIDAYYDAPVLDGSPKEIAAPPEQLDSNTTFTPQVVVKNAGLLDRDDIGARFFIISASDGDTIYSGVANSGPIQAGETQVVTFADSVTPATGSYTMTCVTLLPYDGRCGNDTLTRPLTVGPTGVAEDKKAVGRASFTIVPNPLARTATVRYSLPEAGLVTLDVYDVTGRTVLSRTIAARGVGAEALDLRELKAGVYMVKVKADGFSSTQKLVVER